MDRSMVPNVPYQMGRIPQGQMPPNHQMGGPAPPPTTNPAMMGAYAQQTLDMHAGMRYKDIVQSSIHPCESSH